MTDKELLELAAKAAGMKVPTKKDYPYEYIDERGIHRDISCGGDGTRMSHWNPLTDDGDALRLAVKLGISVHLDLGNRIVIAKPGLFPRVGNEEIHYDESKFGGGCDPHAATRRAIVRAAAVLEEQRASRAND